MCNKTIFEYPFYNCIYGLWFLQKLFTLHKIKHAGLSKKEIGIVKNEGKVFFMCIILCLCDREHCIL